MESHGVNSPADHLNPLDAFLHCLGEMKIFVKKLFILSTELLCSLLCLQEQCSLFFSQLFQKTLPGNFQLQLNLIYAMKKRFDKPRLVNIYVSEFKQHENISFKTIIQGYKNQSPTARLIGWGLNFIEFHCKMSSNKVPDHDSPS